MQIFKQKRGYLIGFIMLLGLTASTIGIISIFNAKKCEKWPVVKGVIIDSFVSSINDTSQNKASTICIPDIKYEYIYKQNTFFNNTISYFPSKTIGLKDFYYAAPESDICKYVEKYPVEKKVDVYVCPYNPEFSILDTTLKLPVFLPLILGLLLIYSACHLIIFNSHYFADPRKQ